ncbi:MAG: DUF4926 domain-containing protein [Rubrobacteraceae bacterium]|jgi:hypothetical protein
MSRTTNKHIYRELDTIPIPEGVPEIGIAPGDIGTIVDMRKDGSFTVEVVEDTGRTLDLLEMVADPEPRVTGRWHSGSNS